MRKRDGKTLWKSPEVGSRFDGIEIIGDYTVVASNGSVNCLHTSNGSLLWRDTFDDDNQGMTLLGNPTHDKPSIFIGYCGHLYKYDLESGEKTAIHKVSENADFCVSMKIHGNCLYVTSEALVVAFDLQNLEKPIWENYIEETGYHASPSLNVTNNGDLDMLVIGNNGYVVTMDISNGQICWTTKIPMCGYTYVSTIEIEGRLYAAASGKLMELNKINGEIVWDDRMLSLKFGPLVLASNKKSIRLNSDHPIIQSQERGSGVSSLFRSLFV